eukprot:364592-Chlamydomonas_euryale.AAC.4
MGEPRHPRRPAPAGAHRVAAGVRCIVHALDAWPFTGVGQRRCGVGAVPFAREARHVPCRHARAWRAAAGRRGAAHDVIVSHDGGRAAVRHVCLPVVHVPVHRVCNERVGGGSRWVGGSAICAQGGIGVLVGE